MFIKKYEVSYLTKANEESAILVCVNASTIEEERIDLINAILKLDAKEVFAVDFIAEERI